MAHKKGLRADGTRIISTDSTDNPKLGAKVLSDGRESLFLDFNFGYTMEVSQTTGKEYPKKVRKRESLSLYLWQAPRTPLERQQNKETLELAKKIRFERGQQLLNDVEGYRLKKEQDINFIDWMWAYYDAYNKADKRSIKRAVVCFVDFMVDPECEYIPVAGWTEEQKEKAKQEKADRVRILRVKPETINKDLIIEFTEYLQRRFIGEGAHTVYARFKKIINAAVEKDVMRKNPCNGVVIKIDKGTLKKDVLSVEEVALLAATHYRGENPDIRRAFIFCLYTGLRWADVRLLAYANVDFANRLLKFEQSKTAGHSAASSVVIPLNDSMLSLVGKGGRDELIFPLPSHTMCNKALKHWTERAGIEKHITWHCARHSFAVNVLNNGANIKTVASLLGHSGLQHTEKYTRAVDKLKEAAVNSLPELKL